MRGSLHVVFCAAVGLLGLAALIWAGLPTHLGYLLLSAVTVAIVVRYHLRLPGGLTYSLATPLIIAGTAYCGMAGGLWLAVFDALLRAWARREHQWWRDAFTVGQAALCAAVAGLVYQLLAPLDRDYVGGALASAAFLLFNLGLFAAMVSIYPDTSLRASFSRTAAGATEMQFLEVVAGGLLVGLIHAGEPVGIGLMMVILIMFSLAVRRLFDAQFQSRSDPLTRLWNLRGFADDFQDALDRYALSRQPFGIVVLDLDRFKQVNDTYGHDVGNQVLRIVAERLDRHVRQVDGVYRIGGEEFAVLMPGIREDTLMERARQLEAALRDEPVRLEGRVTLSLSASVGYALCPDDGEDYESLFRHADQCMYRVKQRRHATVDDEAAGAGRAAPSERPGAAASS